MAQTPSVRTASTTEEVNVALEQASHQEELVTAKLRSSVASQKKLSLELGRLDILRTRLSTVVSETHAISNDYLSDAASNAKRISSAVHRLDQEQNNVRATLELVEQVAELKACVLGVHGSMGAAQDWETAASYLSRASKIPAEIIDGSFAERVVPTADVPDPPRITLNNAAESLCRLFLRDFEKAAKEGDGARVTRFFKLFPLIGRSEAGLNAYGRYVCQGVAARARSNLNRISGDIKQKDGYFYANALTKLFEHIAQIVDGHERLVESYYGAGRMVRVIKLLQAEADSQGGIILDTWSDERSINRKLTEIKSYAFSFFVQSFQSARKGGPSSRSDSPAKRDVTACHDGEDSAVDMKEIDGILSEIAIMLGRWSLYTRFVASKCQDSDEEDSDEDGDENFSRGPLTKPDFLLNAALTRKVTSTLISPFSTMTGFFLRSSVEKAFQLDESPSLSLSVSKPLPSNPPYITSTVDDVMYILSQLLTRALNTSQATVVTAVLPDTARILSADFIGMIQRKMSDECYPKPAAPGSLPPEDKIVAFLILINNLDVASNYVDRIVGRLMSRRDDMSQQTTVISSDTALQPKSSPLADIFPFANESLTVSEALISFKASFDTKSTDLLSDSINVAFHYIIKPRIKRILKDTFRDVDYNTTTSSSPPLPPPLPPPPSAPSGTLSDPDEPPSPPSPTNTTTVTDVTAHFTRSWTALTAPLIRILTPANADRLLSIALPAVATALENHLWSLHEKGVSEAGAAQLERDVAGIAAAAAAKGRYALRDAFARCLQICLVLCFEDEEWAEILGQIDMRRKGRGGHTGAGAGAGAGTGRGDGDDGDAEEGDEDEREWALERDEMVSVRAMLRSAA